MERIAGLLVLIGLGAMIQGSVDFFRDRADWEYLLTGGIYIGVLGFWLLLRIGPAEDEEEDG